MFKSFTQRLFFTFVFVGSAGGMSEALFAQEGMGDFFEAKIRPVLEAECIACHGEEKKKGGLLLDSKEGITQGGASGSLFDFAILENSLLLRVLTHQHEDKALRMPLNAPALDEKTIKDFREWIAQGAVVPTYKQTSHARRDPWEFAYQQRKTWWSYLPLQQSEIPKNGESHPVDAFIQQSLESVGIEAAPLATFDERVRRLSYRLNGVPPVHAVETSSWEQVVDGFLSRPRYGETMARYWMDLMRYAESHGSEGDFALHEAYKYRDYLIRAFNLDLPYDRLVKEHLAGDLIEPRWSEDKKSNESKLGLAQLRMNEYGYQPVDTLDEQVKVVDNLIDVYSKTFLGLTVSCARCHHHKFDPISQDDFFALYGIFDSSRPVQIEINDEASLKAEIPELQRLKGEIKTALIQDWRESVVKLQENFQEISDLTKRLESEQSALQLQVLELKRESKGGSDELIPQPLKRWSFETDEKLTQPLLGKARVKNGLLQLDGKDSYFDAGTLEVDVKEKTLEAWVRLEDLDQRGGGLISIETLNGQFFDALVFGEASPKSWVAGSNNFTRSKLLNGPETQSGIWVHLAVSYAKDGSIQIYRNGMPYGAAYKPSNGLFTFQKGQVRLLIGKRHTGGGRAYLKGEIDEVRFYAEALTPQAIEASYKRGVYKFDEKKWLASLDEVSKNSYLKQREKVNHLRKQLQQLSSPKTQRWISFAHSSKAKDLTAWNKPQTSQAVANLKMDLQKRLADRARFNQENFDVLWDASQPQALEQWYQYGTGMNPQVSKEGTFTIFPEGQKILNELLPQGVYSHLFSNKHAGLFMSPRFKMEHDRVFVNQMGNEGGGVRLISDNYPLNLVSTFPMARPKTPDFGWSELDTAYRRDAQVYLEFATNRDNALPGVIRDGVVLPRSAFGVSKIYGAKSEGKRPQEEHEALDFAWEHFEELLGLTLPQRLAKLLHLVTEEWEADQLSPSGRLFLNELLKAKVLSQELGQSKELDRLVAEYRRVEAKVLVPNRAPSMVEADGFNARLMNRGNHKDLKDEVPRGFLRVLSSNGKSDLEVKKGSGRLELANATVADTNPLFARVMVNRVWTWLFGKGLVQSVDNFGRLGEKPTHPELLDYLANYFKDQNYSIKALIRHIALSKTFQRSIDGNEKSFLKDQTNQYYSRADVVRLSAEQIRDGMLVVSGQLDHKMFGPPAEHQSHRSSVYLLERRNSPHAFLEVFDKPKPAATRGLRDRTNIPAQSLTLLNDPFVLNLCKAWSKEVLQRRDRADLDGLIQEVYQKCYHRKATDFEIETGKQYLAAPLEESLPNYLHILFSLKEFIYLR